MTDIEGKGFFSDDYSAGKIICESSKWKISSRGLIGVTVYNRGCK